MSIERWQFEAEDMQVGIIDWRRLQANAVAVKASPGYLLALLGFSLLELNPGNWTMSCLVELHGRSPLFDKVAAREASPRYDIRVYRHADDGLTEDAANVLPGKVIELHVVVPDDT